MACRLEHLSDVGSFVTYEVADVGLIVMQTAHDTIKAFHNSCLHRGTTLAEGEGRGGGAPLPVSRVVVEPRRHHPLHPGGVGLRQSRY